MHAFGQARLLGEQRKTHTARAARSKSSGAAEHQDSHWSWSETDGRYTILIMQSGYRLPQRTRSRRPGSTHTSRVCW
jgi:hypothetical protein